jgi:ribose transport system ATP-binding protein
VLVELVGVEKRFRGVVALRGASLTIQEGEVHALAGENGAGKSTLGKVLCGAVSPSAGEMRVRGRPVTYRSPRDALGDGIVLISQEVALVPARSVLENVFLGLRMKRAAERETYERLAAQAGFAVPAGACVGSLSIAQQMQVEVLRALARNASLIVMDEPTAALPADESARLHAIVRSLRERGTAVVYVSHHLEECLRLADRVTVMKDGGIVRTSQAAEETAASLVTAMLGRVQESAFPTRPPLPASSEAALHVEGLSTAADARSSLVVRDVSFSVRKGEILGIAGLVGSGRSELARAIFGAERRTAGTVSVGHRQLVGRGPREAIRAGLVLVPESRKDDGLVLQRTAAENIALPNLPKGARGLRLNLRTERSVATAVLERVGGEPGAAPRVVGNLSGGNQQKVLFAKWLVGRPSVLIADEPTRGIDVGAKRSIYDLLVKLAEGGIAIVLISSELEEILALAHRVLVMREGRVVDRLDGDNIGEQRVMRAAFGFTDHPTEN